MTLFSHEEVSQMVYEDTYGAVLAALEPFDLSESTIERVAEEAAELAVDRELDPRNER